MNPNHDFGLYKQEVSHLPSETIFLHFFSLMTRKKGIVNNVGWNIPNDNYCSDSAIPNSLAVGLTL